MAVPFRQGGGTTPQEASILSRPAPSSVYSGEFITPVHNPARGTRAGFSLLRKGCFFMSMPHTSSALTSAALADRIASRNEVFGVSIWTDIFRQFAKHEDPIYFGDGAPAKDVMPVDRLREASATAWESAPASLAYGDQQGFPELRQLISERMANRGITASADSVLVTAGSTQGIELVTKVFVDPGDAVLVESPTFLGALEVFQAHQARIIQVPMDEDGMVVDEVEGILANEPTAKMIYTIPTFHNPTGTTMPLARRQQLLEVARRLNVAIIEDDPYGELQYDGDVIPPLRALDDQVIHLGTFSKTIGPGLRTGWTIAPESILRYLIAHREITDISNDRITMRTVYHTAKDFLDDHLVTAKALYTTRRDVMLASLEAEMPEGVTFSRPRGGFFVWLTLPEDVGGPELFDLAAEHGVIFFPGNWFYAEHDRPNTLRLSFSTVPEDRIREGVRRLGVALREALGALPDS